MMMNAIRVSVTAMPSASTLLEASTVNVKKVPAIPEINNSVPFGIQCHPKKKKKSSKAIHEFRPFP